MPISALPTIALATRRLRRAAPVSAVMSSTIRSSFREVFGGGGFGGGIFETFFGGGERAEDRRRGSDLRYDMQIKLEEAAFGAERD